jgi:hypothetical protein
MRVLPHAVRPRIVAVISWLDEQAVRALGFP